MRTLSTLFTLALFSLGSFSLRADEGKRSPASSGVVTIEVLIADVAQAEKGDDADDKAIVGRIRELEKQGKLSRVTRIRLTTLGEQNAMAQFGERAPLAMARASFGGGGRGGAGPGGEGSSSFTYQNIGTLAQVTPRVDGDRIIMECMVEQSRMVPRKSVATATVGNQPAVERPERSFEPDSVETITAKSVVQVNSGDTALLASKQHASGDGNSRTYIFVTATIEQPARNNAAALKIFSLVNADSATVAESLRAFFEGHNLQIAVEKRTNSIIVRGQDEDLTLCAALLEKLDAKE